MSSSSSSSSSTGCAPTAWYPDLDEDAFGDSAVMVAACVAPEGHVANGDDCDDSSPTNNPEAPEVCDTIDNDCDSITDEDAVDPTTFYRDADGDGAGDPGLPTSACTAQPGLAAEATDCDDADHATYPGAPELCDSLDNDCDEIIDENASAIREWFRDSDDDGYGEAGAAVASCSRPPGFVGNARDCDDADMSIHPYAPESCNSKDDDCDGVSDESCSG